MRTWWVVGAAIWPAMAAAQGMQQGDVQVTIYNSGVSLVQDARRAASHGGDPSRDRTRRR